MEIADHYRRAFLEMRIQPDHHEPLFPGARDALAALDAIGVNLGIATGKGRRGLIATLDSHNLVNHFVTLQTADDGPGKPHPGMLRRAMQETGSEPERTVLIGDTVFDMEMARSAGVRALGVSWGYHPTDELQAAGAARIIDSFAQLIPALIDMSEEP